MYDALRKNSASYVQTWTNLIPNVHYCIAIILSQAVISTLSNSVTLSTQTALLLLVL